MHTICLINMKGGVGKTTLTINLADFLSRREKNKVLLIDIDPQFNTTQCLFNGEEYVKYLRDEKDTILKIFDDNVKRKISTVKGTTNEETELKDVKPYKISNFLHILPGNLELFKLEMASGSGKENKLKQYIEEISAVENYDYVLIDTPPTPSVWMTSALIASDFYLIPVKPDPMSFIGIDLLENIVEQKKDAYNLSIKCVGLIFTMVERDDSIVYQNALRNVRKDKKWKDLIFSKYIPKRTEIAKLQLEKKFILDSEDATAKSSMSSIVKELKDRL
ncbi:Sporulation initiation inhibitor protein Soj [Flavobacterium sp. ACN2]|uniref:ParA family protein n=1 Tax=Flavobacterium sp. ACN2 TaxID=1975676 RepID=UPI000BB36841|nr:ParA family protein [Flavobacterium sp. ACN2]PBI83547.1 Sporulation initiation inhibitor protein Soj [Flavobacterium sp. ACN2]